MASTDEDPNGSDDESVRPRGHRMERMTVGGVRGEPTSMIDVDMTPPDMLLQMASERAQKLTRRNKVSFLVIVQNLVNMKTFVSNLIY